MNEILAQILELVNRAPLTAQGKEDIRHTIRTEFSEPLPVGVEIVKKPVRLIDPEEVDCDCPVLHRHSRNNGMILCFECGCAYTPRERPVIVQRVKLV